MLRSVSHKTYKERNSYFRKYLYSQKENFSPHIIIFGLCHKLNNDEVLMRLDIRLQYVEFLPYDVRHPLLLPQRNRGLLN